MLGKRKSIEPTPKIRCVLNATEQAYDEHYGPILNCLTNPDKYNDTKDAVLRFLYKRGENEGHLINRRETIGLCDNKKLLNMYIADKRPFNFETDNVCCSICGIRITPNDEVEIDHLIPSTLFFCLFARYYHGGCQHENILKNIHGQQFCDEYYQLISEGYGKFVTKLMSVTHKGCNQAKVDNMFFIINVDRDNLRCPNTPWNLTKNQPVIDAFIDRYISKLYPADDKYTGVGYMNAADFEKHALALTNGISRADMLGSMTTRLNSFVETVSLQYKGGIMRNIFDNLYSLKTLPLSLIKKKNKVSIFTYVDDIDAQYGSRLASVPPDPGILNDIVEIIETSTEKKETSRPARISKVSTSKSIYARDHHSTLYDFFIYIDVLLPSFEQICEVIDSELAKKKVENEIDEAEGLVRRKTKRIRKIIKRRPTKANKTRNKRTIKGHKKTNLK